MYEYDELCDIILFTECNMPNNFIIFTPCVLLNLVNVDQLNTSLIFKDCIVLTLILPDNLYSATCTPYLQHNYL